MTAIADEDRPPRRRYDNALRREKAAETRRRIVTAGSALLHASHVRDWEALTVRAVAQGAGVNERTVYRHFVNERGLRSAVMQHLEEEAGIDLEGMLVEDVAEVAMRIFEHVSSFPLEPGRILDPTLADANRRQHEALLNAVAAGAPDWSVEERNMAAGAFDVLWSVAAYERLVRDWELAPEQAIQCLGWVIGIVATSVRDDRRPGVGR